jgi:hypothetical protein
MWQVKSNTEFSTQGYFIRDRAGAEHWVAALRATFDIVDGGPVKIAEEQIPVLLAPAYADDEAGELKSESDIAPFRPKPDFTVRGTACLPDMAAARALEASVSIGALTKRAAVTCPRMLRKRDGRLSVEQGDPFGGIALTWRNSLGGADLLPKPGGEAETEWANPVGRGWTRRWRDLPDGADIMFP